MLRLAAAASLALTALAPGGGWGAGGRAAPGGYAGQPGVEAATFHHLHLASPGPHLLAGVYARLFKPGTVTRGVFWGFDGLAGAFHLLVAQADRPDAATALWHFGWGEVSLGETYGEHYRREVNWRPPYDALDAGFHVHLRSRDPGRAADWYQAALGAEVSRHRAADSQRPDAVAALARFESIVLAIHGMEPGGALVSTRAGGAADHLAFLVRDPSAVPAAADAGEVPAAGAGSYALRDLPSTFVTGPDAIVLELLPAPRGPAFWHRTPAGPPPRRPPA